jgi:hypothetical protein
LANGPRRRCELSGTYGIDPMIRGAFLGLLAAFDAMPVSGFYLDFFLFMRTLCFVYILRAAFIPKSNRKRFVIHKSGNLEDNSLDNLITVNKRSFKKDHRAGRPKKKYVEQLEKEVFLSDEVLNELKIAYEASLIKGNYRGSQFDFINEIFGELMNEYTNRKGLKKIIHQLKSTV